jgi:hypothetical protein
MANTYFLRGRYHYSILQPAYGKNGSILLGKYGPWEKQHTSLGYVLSVIDL